MEIEHAIEGRAVGVLFVCRRCVEAGRLAGVEVRVGTGQGGENAIQTHYSGGK
jgi:hypothetical protein